MLKQFITNSGKRESNFEILRIICMLGIVLGHIVLKHMNFNLMDTSTKYITMFLGTLPKICYVGFIALTMWFIVDADFRSKKIVMVYCEAFFYFIVLYFINIAITKQPITAPDLLSYIFVICGGRSNFVTPYILFLLLSPFLAMLKNKITKKQSVYLLSVLFFSQILIYVLGTFVNFNWAIAHVPSILLAYVFIYFLINHLKGYSKKISENKWVLVLFILISQAICFISRCCSTKLIPLNNDIFMNFLNSLTSMEYSLFNIIPGICLIFLFNFKMKKNYRIINIIATPTLGILLIHEHMSFKDRIFNDWLKLDQYINVWWKMILAAIISTMLIYIVCGLVDLIRKIFIETPIFNTKKLNNLFAKIDNIFKK